MSEKYRRNWERIFKRPRCHQKPMMKTVGKKFFICRICGRLQKINNI